MTRAGISIRLAAGGILLLVIWASGVSAEAGTRPAASAPKPVTRPAQEGVRPEGRPAVSGLRTGVHPSHTRVVLDLSAPAEWSVERQEEGALVIVVRNAALGEGIRAVAAAHGVLRGIQPKQVPGGVEVRLVTAQSRPEYRMFTLENPDRIVVDLVHAEPAIRQAPATAKPPSGPAAREELRPSQSPARPIPAPQTASAGVQAGAPAARPAPPAPLPPGPTAAQKPEPSRSLPPGGGAPMASGPSIPPRPPAAVAEAPPPRTPQPLPPTAAAVSLGERDGPTEELRIAAVPPPAAPAPPPGELSAAAQAPGRERARDVPPQAEASRQATQGRQPWLTVVIDPGHGGHDTGAIGPSGLMEKDVVLDLGLRLRRLLEERLQVRVLMTRSEDVFVSLAERTAIANRAKADFFISLHVNAAEKRGAIGFETFFFAREPSDSDARASAQRENLVLDTNGAAGADRESLLKMTLADMAVTRDMKESSTLAELVLTSLDKSLKVENRGVKSGPFYVLATAAMPAILVESAFITNPREERRLQREDHRQLVAEALYAGIARYKTRYEQRLGMRPGPAANVGS